jgi:hypothetical protein
MDIRGWYLEEISEVLQRWARWGARSIHAAKTVVPVQPTWLVMQPGLQMSVRDRLTANRVESKISLELTRVSLPILRRSV